MPPPDKTRLKIASAALVTGLAYAIYAFLPADCPEAARRTAFVFVFGAFFWAFEIIPLYATSLLVVILQILLLALPDGLLGGDAGDYQLFLNPFASPVILLFFGGFMMAAALRRHGLDRHLVLRLLKVFGSRPYAILLGFMLTTGFLSMWMSNTATTALMLAMVFPLLSNMEAEDRFKTALALAIPFAANIGGVGTPIGTPPNAIAIGLLASRGMHVGFLSWMAMAVPLAVILILLTSILLMRLFPPKHKTLVLQMEACAPPNFKAWGVVTITAGTVFLWLTSGWHGIPEGVTALLAVCLLTGLGLTGGKDIKSIDWDVLILMWGGLALGEGMHVSGLAGWITDLPVFGQSGLVLIAVFCVLALLLSTVMSNTATASLLMPIVLTLPQQESMLLAVAVALSCSFAMALPISTPPNAMAFATGSIKSTDMLKSGAVISLVALISVILGLRWVFGWTLGSG